MNTLWKSIKWAVAALAIFGALVLGDLLRGGPITPRHYAANALMACFFTVNSLPLKWSVRRRFVFNFGYVFCATVAVLFYFGEPFTWIKYVFTPSAIALSMTAIFSANALIRAQAERK